MIKKKFFIACLALIYSSCNAPNYLPGFDFELFKNTPVWELAKAVENENINKIELILKGTTIEIDFHEPKFGNTLLSLAVVNNKNESVKKLLEMGANPNEIVGDNETPLMYTCRIYSEDCDSTILKQMIYYHGNVNYIQNVDRIEDNGAHTILKRTVLMTAARHNCIGIIKVLVEAGADINEYTYYEGYGAITEALIQDNVGIAKYIIIDRHARIPKYCFIRIGGNNNRQYMTITDMLNEHNYEANSNNQKYKEEIINYLKVRNLK